nr:hypothetical protein [Tanacetum cinerariifolium]
MKATWNAITRQGNDSGKACDVFGFNLLARDMMSPSSTNISDFENKFDLGLSFILGLVVMTWADLVGLLLTERCLLPTILLPIEDAFSSNFPDYTTASPNYFPASPGNISPDPLDNLSKYLFASLAISPFHNMQTYNAVANKPPIPPQDPITPPNILTPSLVLPPSPLFDPRYFFVPKELLPPKKQIHPPSSYSITLSNLSRKQACILVPPSFSTYTPTPPQIYELGKNSIKMRVKHHEEQVESILIYLEELSFHCIEKMEERLVNGWIIIPRDFDEMPPKKTSTSEAPAMTQAAIKKLVADNVATALEIQAATMANTNNPNRNSGLRRTPITRKCTYEKFMSCQPFYFNGMEGAVGLIRWLKKTESTIGVKEANKITWSEFKRLLIKKYCPQSKIKKMEEAITMTQKLKHNSVQETNNHKQKLEDRRNTTNGNNNNYHNNNHSNDHHQQQNRRQETFKTYTATNGYTGNRPLLAFAIICKNGGVIDWYQRHGYREQERCLLPTILLPIEDAFSSNFPDYTTASPNYFPASPRNISPDPPDNLSKYLFASLAILPFHNVQTYNAVANKPPIPPQDPITPPNILTPSLMPPKRTLTSEAPAMTQAAIRKLVADNVPTALETQAATMANTNNPNRNSRLRRTPIARKCTYKKFMSCQPFYFNGMEGAVGLIHWLKQTESNSFAQTIGVKRAYKITWSEFKRLLIKKYCPKTKIKKMEEAITMTQKLKHNSVQETNNHKQKLENRRSTTNGNNNNYRNNNHSNDHHQQPNRKQETLKTYTATNGYTGNYPLCKKCTLHHIGPCTVRSRICNKTGHQTRNCRNKVSSDY